MICSFSFFAIIVSSRSSHFQIRIPDFSLIVNYTLQYTMTAPSPVQETFRIAAIVPYTRRDDVPRPSLLEPSPSQTSQQSVPSMSVSTDQEAVNTSNTVQPQQVQQETTARQLSTSLPNPVVPTLGRRKSKQFAVSTQWEREMAQGTLPKDIHSYFCCCATRIGNMSALLTYSDGTPLLIAGPCWPFCVFVTLPVLLGVPVVVIYFIFIGQTQSNLPDWVMAIYIPAVVFTLIALCCVSCRNPGLMERVTDEEAGDGGWFWKYVFAKANGSRWSCMIHLSRVSLYV